jgi:queuine tRNA-ribosyltransferase
VKLRVEIDATDGAARTGRVRTARGEFRTPLFMPVGTRSTIKAATIEQVEALGGEVMLANTYHLMLRPGAEVIAALGGLHRFQGWNGQILTDSGGYQVFSLGPKISEDGATFRSVYDGSVHHLTPEGAVGIQEQLGADIQMALDVCLALPADRAELRRATELTVDWAARARATHRRRGDQALFGIVQGGDDVRLRAECAGRIVAMDFDGYAVGGLSVGEPIDAMVPALAAAVAELPADQPRYFMGIGDPLGIIEAVSLGVDMMDCVLPTRLGRHGTLLTSDGRLNIGRAEFARSDEPPDPGCSCAVCQRHCRGYLRHLITVGEPAGATLCTLHNLAWMFRFIEDIRDAITAGRLAALRSRVRECWGRSR